MGLTALEHGAPDGDRGIEVAVVAEVAGSAAVQAPALALGGRDELHRADLGRPGQGAGREHRAQRIERIEVGLEPPFDVRDEMQHVAVLLDLHVLADGDRARPRDAAEVIAAEVHEHHVLGTLLRVARQAFCEELVLALVRTAREGARDRVRREAVALDLEQQLRRRSDDLVGRGPDEEQVWARVDPPEGAIQADAVELRARGRIERQAERLAAREHDLDGLTAGDGFLGHPDRGDVLVATERALDGSGQGLRRDCATGRDPQFGGARPLGPLERLEDGRFGDPVAALEVRRLGMQRRDGRQRVGQVIEDEDEVRLDERGRGHADRITVGQRDARLEGAHGVVGQGADGPTGKPRHTVGRQDAALGDERPDGVERIGRLECLDGQVRCVVAHRHRAGLNAGDAGADLEQATRTGAQEGVAAGPLPALDGFEQVGRTTVIEAQKGADGRLEVGRTRGP